MGINPDNSAPDPSAMLDVKSINKGMLIPRMTTAQRTAVISPATGLMVFDTDAGSFWFYTGSAWQAVGTDNLGNHTAKQNLNLDGNYLSGDGDNEGILVNTNGLVGIGTDSPDALLDIKGGALLAQGATGATPVSGAGTRLMWIPGKAAFRAGQVDGAQWDEGNIGPWTFVGGGYSNTASGDLSFVGGGAYNTASGPEAFVGGGSSNTASAVEAFVGGGQVNTASGDYSFVGGGQGNTASEIESFIGGGLLNTASGSRSFVGGGSSNTAAGERSFVGGGDNNTASGTYSFAGSGQFNTASGDRSFVGGGENLLAKSYSEAVFGTFNTDYTPASTTTFNTADRLFVIGNGTDSDNRSNAFTVLKSGSVGIGTDSPQAPLHVTGTRVTANGDGNYFYYVFPNNAPTQDINTASEVVGYFDGDIVAQVSLISMNVSSWSDGRAKHILRRSDSRADLDLLNQLQITDYQWIDQAADHGRVHKKVIAQEVELVLPAAVSRMRKPIPNVYANAARVEYNPAAKTLTVYLDKTHDFVVGDQVQVFTDREDLNETEVLAVASPTSFAIACEKEPTAAFVFGKWVEDYRKVDYDAIAMLNVSATQEQQRIIEEQQQKIEELEAKNKRMSAEFSQLKSLVQQLSQSILKDEKEVNNSSFSGSVPAAISTETQAANSTEDQ